MSLPASREAPIGEAEARFQLPARRAAAMLAPVQARLQPVVRDVLQSIEYRRTTYLDTSDFAISSSSRRVRVREYASAANETDVPQLTGACFLEVKHTGVDRRAKLRLPMQPAVLREAIQGGTSVAVLTTFYRRRELILPGHRVRITIDEGIQFAEPVLPGSSGEVAPPPDVLCRLNDVIVEIKYASPLPDWLVSAVRDWPSPKEPSKLALGLTLSRSLTLPSMT